MPIQPRSDPLKVDPKDIRMLNWDNIKDEYYCATPTGQIILAWSFRPLTPFISNTGYYRINLALNDGSQKKFSVHRLIAKAYHPDTWSPERNQVNHINGDKLDNRPENLEWVSQSYNNIHAYDNNLAMQRGVTSHLHKDIYSDEVVHQICQMLQDGYSMQEILPALNILKYPIDKSSIEYRRLRGYIKNIKYRNCRRDITQHYSY